MFGRCTYSTARAAQDLVHARRLVGTRLSLLSHQQYYFNGEKDLADIGPLVWRCAEQVVSMYLLSDGESVGADPLPFETPQAFELEPGVICAWKEQDLLADLSVGHLQGQLIQEVEGIVQNHSNLGSRLVGFKITFGTGDFLVFLNQGDDGVVLFNQFPAAVPYFSSVAVTEVYNPCPKSQ